MSEKSPQFERPPIEVLGPAKEEEKQKVSAELEQKFKDGEFTDFPPDFLEQIKGLEYEKRGYEIDFIVSSNKIINNLLEKYGLTPFDVSEKNVHILPPDIFKKLTAKPFTAFHDYKRQITVHDAEKLRKYDNRLRGASDILHELIHLKGFLSMDVEAEKGKIKRKANRRIGLMVSEGYRKSDKKEWYESFIGLNEAVVSEIENRYAQEVLASSSDQGAQEELKWLRSEESAKIRRDIGKEENIAPDEIEWLSRDGKKWIGKSYQRQRMVLQYVVEQISADSSKTSDDIYELFFKAHFTGNIIEIARLIEETFGTGTFRVLGMMTGEAMSANQMLDHLRKQRIRIKNDEKD